MSSKAVAAAADGPSSSGTGVTASSSAREAQHALYASQYSSPKPAPRSHLLLLVLSVLPLLVNVPANINIVLTASLTVYCGCWRSIKPAPPTESMTNNDAMRFPLVGSCVLFGLFLLFKFMPAYLVNMLLAGYLGGIAILVLTSLLSPYFVEYFPEAMREKEFKLPPFKIPYLIDATEHPVTLTVPEICVGCVATGFCLWYFLSKYWFANNVLGMAFCLEGIEHLSLGSTQTGAILLVGLFFYDIFWVFFTPVMVSVAKNFDAPIKLLFPRAMELGATKRPFSMLGLGDIVIPGIFVALMLRYDVQHGMRTKYFQSCFSGYVLGIVATLVVMNTFNAAQPALLYIVPGVLGCTLLHAYLAGDFSKVWGFSEAAEEAPAAVEGAKAEPAEAKKTK